MTPSYGMEAVLARAFREGWECKHRVPRVLASVAGSGPRELTAAEGEALNKAAVADAIEIRVAEVGKMATAGPVVPRVLLFGKASLLDGFADCAGAQAELEERTVYSAMAAGRVSTLADLGRTVSVQVGAHAVDRDTVLTVADVGLALGRPADLVRVGRLDRDTEVYRVAMEIAGGAGYTASPPAAASGKWSPHVSRMGTAVTAKLVAIVAALAAMPHRTSAAAALAAGEGAAAVVADGPRGMGRVARAVGGDRMLAAACAPLADAARTLFRLAVTPEGVVTQTDNTVDDRSAADVVVDGRRWLADVLFMWRLAEMGLPAPPAPHT